MKKVLFLCTGNSARSQIAEAFLRATAGEHFEAYSAGLDPRPVHRLTVQVMDEVGINIREQYIKPIRHYMGRESFNYLITVCSDAEKNCPHGLWSIGGHKLYWPFEDPTQANGSPEEKLKMFRDVRDEIRLRILQWLPQT